MNQWINLSAVARVFAVGLLAGAGLPALFALGLRTLTPTRAGEGTVPRSDAQGRLQSHRVAGVALAVVCFVIILICAVFGIAMLVGG